MKELAKNWYSMFATISQNPHNSPATAYATRQRRLLRSLSESAPASVTAFTEDYMNENDIFATFCRDFLRKTEDVQDWFSVKQAKSRWPMFMELQRQKGGEHYRERPEGRALCLSAFTMFGPTACERERDATIQRVLVRLLDQPEEEECDDEHTGS